MPSNRPIYYWDTSIFVAWLQNENRPNSEMSGVAETAEKIHANQAILITSDQLRVELLPATFTPAAREKFDRFFQRRNAQMKRIDTRITTLAQTIRNYYQEQRQSGQDHRRTVGSADAIHLATAIQYEATQFHTFDDGGKDGRSLLELNGNVAGYPLVICKPPFTQYRMPGF